jgi:protein SCO1/2
MKPRWLIGVVGGLFILIVAIGVGSYLVSRPADDPGQITGLVTGPVQIGGPFTLVAHTGRTVSDSDFLGKYLLVDFGYTYCPDVCPTILHDISAALDELGPDTAAVQPLFITVDPQRDTVEVLADYVAAFHPRLIGLTGTDEQVAQAAKAYRVYFAKAAPAQENEPYLMDHSTFIYLMGPDGQYLTTFNHTTSPQKMALTIKEIIKNRAKP